VIAPPEECDDGNIVGGDGCSSTCMFEVNSTCNIAANKSVCSFCPTKKYADSSHASCINCNYDCATCDSTGCLTCSALSNRVLNSTTKKCDPISGFYDDSTNELAPACALDCLTCNSGSNSNCLTCASNKGLASNGTCTLCSLAAGVGCSACAYNSSLTAIACLNCAGGNIQNGTCVPLLNIDLP
jgi:cysteine-rich repeat protein